MTKRQREVLDFIESYIASHRYAPSQKEIAEALGIPSQSAVHRHLVALEERGYIERLPNKGRSIRVKDHPHVNH